ncbi:MAG: beta-L-arabinofuranosidase domain-containing protein, partial [Chitinophagaceae bacterium]
MGRCLYSSVLIVFCLFAGGFYATAQETDLSRQKVAYKVPSMFRLELPKKNELTGYLGERYEANLTNRLLKVDEMGLTAGYITRPGVHRWIGEHIGKYLEAAANTWAVTKDPQLKIQMDRMAATLMNAQLPDGYLGTYTPENYWTSWDVWSHKYNLYGLLAYHKVTGNEKALVVSKKIGDLLCRTFGQQAGQRNILKSGTHVGMAATSVLDPMVDLYMWTGEPKYLEFCEYIVKSYDNEGGPSIVETLLREKRVDKVANAKAYEMLSNILGILKLYRVTKEERLLKACRYAFDDIVSNRLYITGTTSDHERFQDDESLQADTAAHMGEGCVTTTWIQLNMQFFALTGEMKYYNEIEKSVYNQLLAAENPTTGCVSYYTPLMG